MWVNQLIRCADQIASRCAQRTEATIPNQVVARRADSTPTPAVWSGAGRRVACHQSVLHGECNRIDAVVRKEKSASVGAADIPGDGAVVQDHRAIAEQATPDAAPITRNSAVVKDERSIVVKESSAEKVIGAFDGTIACNRTVVYRQHAPVADPSTTIADSVYSFRATGIVTDQAVIQDQRTVVLDPAAGVLGGAILHHKSFDRCRDSRLHAHTHDLTLTVDGGHPGLDPEEGIPAA